jgi:hypothetical protein
MIKSAPFYWLECDGHDCKSRYPHKEDEVSALGQPEFLAENAGESDWKEKGDEHFCFTCWGYCDACDMTGDGPELNATGERQACWACNGDGWVAREAKAATS